MKSFIVSVECFSHISFVISSLAFITFHVTELLMHQPVRVKGTGL